MSVWFNGDCGLSLKYRNSIDEFFIKYCRFCFFKKKNNKDLLCAYCFVVFRKETESHSVGQEKPLSLASPVVAGTGGMGRLVGVSFHFRVFCMQRLHDNDKIALRLTNVDLETWKVT